MIFWQYVLESFWWLIVQCLFQHSKSSASEKMFLTSLEICVFCRRIKAYEIKKHDVTVVGDF